MSIEKRSSLSYEARKAIVPAYPKSSFRAFVFGPYLKPDDVVVIPSVTPGNHEGLLEHARYLRYATSLAINNEGFKAEFGESQDVMDFWTDHLSSSEPATGELHHAYRSCGAVVVFASSVGSFCEMGLFSTFDSIVRKMLILVHDSHRGADSFFNKGILEVIDQSNGKHEFVDFSDHKKCVEIVMKFIKGKYVKRQRDGLFIEEADRRKAEVPRG